MIAVTVSRHSCTRSGRGWMTMLSDQVAPRYGTPLSRYVASNLCAQISAHASASLDGWAMIDVHVACVDAARVSGHQPTVAYFHRSRLPTITNDPIQLAPDFVALVLSPRDKAMAIDIAVEEYLHAGVALVWVVNPVVGTVRTAQPDGSGQFLLSGDTVSASPVLPRFTVTAADLFPPTEAGNKKRWHEVHA